VSQRDRENPPGIRGSVVLDAMARDGGEWAQAGAVVEVHGLVKRFGRREALAAVDLELRRGEIVGLVGANGAGKTTLLRTLSGFLRPDAGSVRVLGHEPWSARERVMERARFAFAPPALFETLSAREHLRHLGRLGARDAPGTADLERVLTLVGLAARADEPVRAFSFGMRQRLCLAQALLPTPALLVLDEPTEGLDPLGILELRAILARLRAELGLTLLYSSHLLAEVGELVDRLVLLGEGRVLFAGTPDELRRGTERLVLSVSDAARAREALQRHGIDGVRGTDGALELAPDALTLPRALELLGPDVLRGYLIRRASLEEALVERLRHGGPAGGGGRS